MSRINAGSVNGLTKASTLNGRFDGSSLDLTVKMAKISNARIIKAQVRIAHPNPIFGIRWMSMIGKMTPPRDDPAATRPRAAPRFAKNHVDTHENAG